MPGMPSGTVPAVRKVVRADVAELSAMLARSFDDDPVSEYFFPAPARRPTGLARFFAIHIARIYLPRGECYTNADLTGAALWGPPGPAPGGMRKYATLRPMVLVLGRHTPRAVRALAALDRRHPHDRQHYYLATLGTEPAEQGKGIGSSLLAPVLERCDAEGLGGYLESSKEANVPFYERHGFKVSDEIVLPGRGPRLWLMWRDPRVRD